MFRHRLCWLGEQFRQSLFERTQTQNLQAPELLQPQHFGGMMRSGKAVRLRSKNAGETGKRQKMTRTTKRSRNVQTYEDKRRVALNNANEE